MKEIPGATYYLNGVHVPWSAFLDGMVRSAGSVEAIVPLFCGRFMPYHLGHFQTHRTLTESYERLHIGIVNPYPLETKLVGERFSPDKNFLTYVERNESIQRAIDSLRVSSSSPVFTTIGPYYPPHAYGERVHWNFCPGEGGAAINHMAVRDDFDQWKLKMYIEKKESFVVVPLVAGAESPYSASRVRELMLADGPWQDLVPDFTAEIIERNNIVERLKRLTASKNRS